MAERLKFPEWGLALMRLLTEYRWRWHSFLETWQSGKHLIKKSKELLREWQIPNCSWWVSFPYPSVWAGVMYESVRVIMPRSLSETKSRDTRTHFLALQPCTVHIASIWPCQTALRDRWEYHTSSYMPQLLEQYSGFPGPPARRPTGLRKSLKSNCRLAVFLCK